MINVFSFALKNKSHLHWKIVCVAAFGRRFWTGVWEKRRGKKDRERHKKLRLEHKKNKWGGRPGGVTGETTPPLQKTGGGAWDKTSTRRMLAAWVLSLAVELGTEACYHDLVGEGLWSKERMACVCLDVILTYMCCILHIYTFVFHNTCHGFEGAIPNWFANKFSRPPIAGWLEKCTWPNLCWALWALFLGPMLSEDTSTETHKINPLVWLDDLDFLLQEMEANSELEEALQVAKLWDRWIEKFRHKIRRDVQ